MPKIKMLRDLKVSPNGYDVEAWTKDSEHDVSDSLAFDLEEGLVAVPVTGDAKADAKTAADAAAALKKAQEAEAATLKALAAGPAA